jgi:sulfoxide reductase heme-binding subunit YedZ
MLGLFAFFYGTLHLVTYVIADRFASLGLPAVGLRSMADLASAVASDIYGRPFITVGFTAWIVMLPLALTSTAGMIRRLSGRRWQQLHRLIYASAVAAVLHYWWLVKADVRRPQAYAMLVATLLVVRLWRARRQRAPAAARAAA